MAVRFMSIWLCVFLPGGFAGAQGVSLVEAPLAKASFRISLKMELTGEIRVQQDGKKVTFKQSARAQHEFLERVLEVKNDVADKTARLYQSAEAEITVNGTSVSRKLRPDRALMIAQRTRDGALVYCPKGVLNQAELELTEHLDTLSLSALLPAKEVAAGATWSVKNDAVQALCDLEGLIEHDLTGKLEEVKNGIAHIALVGQVKGIHLGAEVKMLIEAKGEFDLAAKRLVRLQWKQSDQRQQGPVNPALSADVTYTLTRTPIPEPNDLGDIALVPALAVAAETVTPIVHVDSKGRFELQHGREWHLVGEQDNHLVLRLVDRGDFVAQATLTPFKKEEPGKMMPLNDFADLMAEAPGWSQDNLIDKTDKVDVGGGVKAYRVSASGELEGVKAVQCFYLMHGLQGHQILVTFTMAPNQVRNLDTRDLTMLRGIALPKKNDDQR